jgi:hypothetical protein
MLLALGKRISIIAGNIEVCVFQAGKFRGGKPFQIEPVAQGFSLWVFDLARITPHRLEACATYQINFSAN